MNEWIYSPWPSFLILPPGTLKVKVRATNATYSVGSDVLLACDVSGDQLSNVNVQWLKDGLGLPYDDRYVVNDLGELLIEDVTTTDAGEFTCIATRGLDRAEGSEKINIEGRLAFPYGLKSAEDSDSALCSSAGAKFPVDCEDKPWYANCGLIVEAKMCRHVYFSDFCCKSCHEAGLLPWGCDKIGRFVIHAKIRGHCRSMDQGNVHIVHSNASLLFHLVKHFIQLASSQAFSKKVIFGSCYLL